MRADIDEGARFEPAEDPTIEEEILARLRFVDADLGHAARRLGRRAGQACENMIKDTLQGTGKLLEVGIKERPHLALSDLFELLQAHAEIGEARIILTARGNERDRFGDQLHTGIKLARLRCDDAEPMQRVRVAAIGPQDFAIEPIGLGQAPGAMVLERQVQRVVHSCHWPAY